MPTLFDPVRVGAWNLPNRIIMAPLTRARAGVERVPNALMAEYYSQRASAGLIISEATSVTPMGVGYADTPGIWSAAQIEGWKLVTEAVHKAGGRILLQLWHVGRISHLMFLDGALPVAPSAIAPAGNLSIVRPLTPFVTPRPLDLSEIPGIIDAFRQGAENAKLAGFDGVEIHGANGYLLDQFLQDKTNHRTDAYGGPIENRAHLMLEVTDAVISVWGADHVGMHIAPRGDAHDMGDSNPLATFSYLARELGKRKLAFICAREALGEKRIGPQLKAAFGGSYIANEQFTFATANQVLAAGEADAVAFGVPFIANPDLPERFRLNASLNAPDPSTFYVPGAKGYTDYPFLATRGLMKPDSNIVLSVLDLAAVREGGTVPESFRNTMTLAQRAEQWGYRRFWLAEHHNMSGIASAATSVLIGHVAGGTKTIRVGSGGIMLPNHAPLVIAEQFGTLEALYPGRIDLGLGRAPGTDGLTAQALGRDPRAGDRFPALVQELLHYLGPVSPGQRIQAVPGGGSNVPVWLLGSSTFSAQLAAELGLPFAFAGQFAPQLMLEAIRLYREYFKPSANLDKPYAVIGLPVLAADTDEHANHLATSARQRVLRLIRGQPIFTPRPVATMDGLWNPAEQQAVESHFGAAVIGGPATVERKLREFLQLTKADELMLHSDCYRLEDRLRSYEIVSRLFLKPTTE